MAKDKQQIKINKKHGGKEFNNYFHYVGKVKKGNKKEGDNWVPQDYLQNTKTKTNKNRKVLQFIIETAPKNELKIENNGMEKDFVFLYSGVEGSTYKLPWNDRHDKSKYPDESYHLMAQEWDLVDELAEKLEDGVWVEVKGKYEFSTYTYDGKEQTSIKRMVSSVEPVESGQEIKVNGEKITYVTDFDSSDFKEVNNFEMQIGIKSTYLDPNTQETRVNAVFLSYGKEQSTINDIELKVYGAEYKSLSQAFTRLKSLDVMRVTGRDNNRAEFAYVEVQEVGGYNPFADIEEKTVRYEKVTSGTRKGLEILSYVQGSYVSPGMTESDITKPEPVVTFEAPKQNLAEENPFLKSNESPFEISDDMLPF